MKKKQELVQLISETTHPKTFAWIEELNNEVRIFDSAFDYAKTAEVSHFRDSSTYSKTCVVKFYLDYETVANDNGDFLPEEPVIIGGDEYCFINWGENYISLVPVDIDREALFCIYDDGEARPQVYETREEAEESI